MGGNHTLQVAIPRSRRLRLHRRLQLGPARRVSRTGGGRRGAAPPARSRGGATPRSGRRRASRRTAAPQPNADEWAKKTPRRSTTRQLKKGLKLFWFATGKDDFLLHDDERDGGSLQEARLHAGLQGIRRRPHVDQLARLSERVRAATVSVALFVPGMSQIDGCRSIGSACASRREAAERARWGCHRIEKTIS